MSKQSEKISNFVKQTRKAKHLSIQKVVDNCELSRSYINMIESGVNLTTNKPISPTLNAIGELCKGLGISSYEFLNEIGFLDINQSQLSSQYAVKKLLKEVFSNEGIDFDVIDDYMREKIMDSLNQFLLQQVFLYKERQQNNIKL